MAPNYAVSGIDYRLGNYGLDSNCLYSSYDAYMPNNFSNMMFSPSVFPYQNNMYGVGMGLGMNMYNPMFMSQMQHNVEASQLIHSNNMHKQILENEVIALRDADSTLVQKIITNGHLKTRVRNLYDVVHSGNQDAICKEWDTLEKYISNTYRDEFNVLGDKISPTAAIHEIIQTMYQEIATANAGDGKIHTFISDTREYGDTAVVNGVMKGLRSGHHDMYVDETLKHCLGLDYDQKESKEKRQVIGYAIGKSAGVVEKGLYGATAAVAATGAGLGLTKGFSLVSRGLKPDARFSKFSFKKSFGKAWFPVALGALILTPLLDSFWKVSET